MKQIDERAETVKEIEHEYLSKWFDFAFYQSCASGLDWLAELKTWFLDCANINDFKLTIRHYVNDHCSICSYTKWSKRTFKGNAYYDKGWTWYAENSCEELSRDKFLPSCKKLMKNSPKKWEEDEFLQSLVGYIHKEAMDYTYKFERKRYKHLVTTKLDLGIVKYSR